jgi:hypothetical protein
LSFAFSVTSHVAAVIGLGPVDGVGVAELDGLALGLDEAPAVGLEPLVGEAVGVALELGVDVGLAMTAGVDAGDEVELGVPLGAGDEPGCWSNEAATGTRVASIGCQLPDESR